MTSDPAKVLIVDDDTDFSEYVRAVLTRRGHEVFVADDGAAGLAIARREKPAVILVDLLMAPQDGFSVCEQLRSEPDTRTAGLLVVSGIRRKLHKSFASPEVGARLDVDGFLEKPVEHDDLVRAVDEALRLARSRSRPVEEGR